jgi:hypothetical protein
VRDVQEDDTGELRRVSAGRTGGAEIGSPEAPNAETAETRSADATPLVRREHDLPGTPYDKDFVGLHRYAQQQLKSEPIRISEEQAQVILDQFRETAAFRGWELLAVAIMSNHIHIVVGVNGDPDPTKVLGDFKPYASRALSRRWGKPPSAA